MKVIIIGGGQVGAYIANLLLSNNINVKIIENRETSLSKLKKTLSADNIVVGSGTDPNVLEASGIAQSDVVIAVTGADETNLVASTIAKFEFDIPRVIARVNNPQNEWLFDSSMGVDVAINQADLMAHLVVEEMDIKNMLTLMKINHGNCSIVQVKVDPGASAANKQVNDLDIPVKAVLIAIYRGKEVIIPRGNTKVLSGDNILAFTDADARIKINALFQAQ
jgi:trk system potassium uptake protein TrkA